MNDLTKFHALDAEANIEKTRRRLPHWFQPGTATFVTFRTDDSMPQAAADLWNRHLKVFLRNHHIDDSLSMTDAMAQMSPEVLQCFENYRNAHYHRMLDKGFGQCVLRNPSLSMIVADTILFFDGDRYDVDRFVVMPNHVHLLVAFRKEFDMRESLESILHYSATCINIELDRLGPFWQSEPFDHCLRHEKQFEWVQNYIKDNPRIAKLCNGNYHYWERTT